MYYILKAWENMATLNKYICQNAIAVSSTVVGLVIIKSEKMKLKNKGSPGY